jgi:hypothetical protein
MTLPWLNAPNAWIQVDVNAQARCALMTPGKKNSI